MVEFLSSIIQCPNEAVLTWTGMPEIFPNGMESVYQKTSLPVVAHNRWWCNETTYSDRNGGSYKVLSEALSENSGDIHFSLLLMIPPVLPFHKKIVSGMTCLEIPLLGA